MPEARIVLVRHAESAHVHTGWINASGLRAWRKAYEDAGIHNRARVPNELARLADSADLVLASDAPRAVASARMLAPADEVVVSPLLRELDLEAPDLGSIRLPLLGWAVLVGARSLLLTLRRQYPSTAEAARLDEAVGWLNELATRHRLIVAVTHASFREQLSARLMRRSWRQEPGARTRQFFGRALTRAVREAALAQPEGHVPIGVAIAVPTGHPRIRYLVVAPTMISPEHVPAANAYRSLRAALKLMDRTPELGDTLFCPGLATLVGGVAPDDAAREMSEAYADWRNSRP